METTLAPRRLFDISADIQALEDLLYESGGDVSDPEVEAALDHWFASLAHERNEKLDGYATVIREMEARAEIRKAEAKRLRDRATVDENIAKRLKDRLVWFFEEHGLKTIETERYRLTRARAGGKTPVILKVDPADLPERFRRVKEIVSADKDAILEAIESGQDVSEYAEIGERSQYLKIS